jgi:serine/threonine protein phosphatase PrpC
MITDKFFITSGSVCGAMHRNTFRNNQDAIFIAENEKALVGIVSDGCSGGKHNEVGSKLITRFICNQLLEMSSKLDKPAKMNKILERVRIKSLNLIRYILNSTGGNIKQNIQDMFLFTIIGVVITDNHSFIFTMGDGAYVLNSNLYIIDQKNQPKYLAYGLIDELDTPHFKIRKVIKTKRIENLILSSDGITYLLYNSEKILKDGKPAGNHNQFLNEERYLKNRSLLQKRLVVFGAINGVLKDDTSIILIRRLPEKKSLEEQGGKADESLY